MTNAIESALNQLFSNPQQSDVVGIVILILLLVLLTNAVLWLFLPFAVFGIKARLDLIARLLRELIDRPRR